jgi:hypothetical protein
MMRHSRLFGFIGLASAISIFTWAFLDPRFRDSEDLLTGKFCLPVALGAAVFFWALALRGKFRRFAFWIGLAFLGQATALQMIHAGKHIHYQHYWSVGHLIRDDMELLCLSFLIVQALLVILGLKKIWPSLRIWKRKNLRTWQMLCLAVAFFLSSAAVSARITDYIIELIFATFIQAVSLGNIILAVWAFPSDALRSLRDRWGRFFGPAEQHSSFKEHGKVDKYAIWGAIWVTCLSAFLVYFSYERHPHVQDEVAYLYQARYFAEGRLAMQAPPVREAFDFYLMQFRGPNWYSCMPPGWPAVLAIGVMLGVPWLVNPVLGGLNIILIYVLLKNLYSRRLARTGIFLLCLSPWYVFMAMNYLTHTLTLTCALLAGLGILLARQSGKARWAAAGGAALGLMSLIRPLEGFIMAVLLGLWSIGLGGRRLKWSSLVTFVLATTLVGGLVLPYNKALTGSALKFPVNVYMEERFGHNANAYGFGRDRGAGWGIDPYPGHSPRDGLINAGLNVFMANVDLWGWSIGSLGLMALFVFSGTLQKSDFLMMAVIAAVFIAMFFYYFSGGPDFGARYWFLMIVPLAALSVRGVHQLAHQLASSSLPDSQMAEMRVMVGVIALSLMALLNYVPWRAIDKYHHYLGMRPDVRTLAREHKFGRDLVLIRGENMPDYSSAAIYNPVELSGKEPIFVWDKSPEVRSRIVRAFPDRLVWEIEGPSITHKGFRVVSGPVPGRSVISGVDDSGPAERSPR